VQELIDSTSMGGRMSRKIVFRILPLLFLVSIGPFVGFAAGQTKTDAGKTEQQLIYSVKGPDLFRAYCATCHGIGGKGNGPAASALKVKPADLTILAKNNGGKFPVGRVQKFIMGDEPSVNSHGSREMPIWGPIFHQIEDDQDLGNVRLQNLIKYLQTIQQM
jgi:mono/diheme cytochrome c family protein